ncbi:MAG: hypothetical protein ACRYGI_10450, partial [Janthinobacterium lividum]
MPDESNTTIPRFLWKSVTLESVSAYLRYATNSGMERVDYLCIAIVGITKQKLECAVRKFAASSAHASVYSGRPATSGYR